MLSLCSSARKRYSVRWRFDWKKNTEVFFLFRYSECRVFVCEIMAGVLFESFETKRKHFVHFKFETQKWHEIFINSTVDSTRIYSWIRKGTDIRRRNKWLPMMYDKKALCMDSSPLYFPSVTSIERFMNFTQIPFRL